MSKAADTVATMTAVGSTIQLRGPHALHVVEKDRISTLMLLAEGVKYLVLVPSKVKDSGITPNGPSLVIDLFPTANSS